jgi:hypothetical protein
VVFAVFVVSWWIDKNLDPGALFWRLANNSGVERDYSFAVRLIVFLPAHLYVPIVTYWIFVKKWNISNLLFSTSVYFIIVLLYVFVATARFH